MTEFATGFLLGCFVGVCVVNTAVLLVVWFAAETAARKENLHASFEKARRE